MEPHLVMMTGQPIFLSQCGFYFQGLFEFRFTLGATISIQLSLVAWIQILRVVVLFPSKMFQILTFGLQSLTSQQITQSFSTLPLFWVWQIVRTWFEKLAIVWFRIFHSRSFPRLGGGQEVILGPFPGRKWSTRLLWRLLLHNPLVLPVFLDGGIRCRHTNCSAKWSRV